MSRIGKKKIEIPEKIEVFIDGNFFKVKGPLGELERTFDSVIKITKKDREISLKPSRIDKTSNAMWGTTASHVRNMICGVGEKFVKNLVISGVGYKAILADGKIILEVGFSHDVKLDIPNGVEVEVVKNNIKVSGIDKEKVGLFASRIRVVKKLEPYKGKGIGYIDEKIKRKAGKKSV